MKIKDIHLGQYYVIDASDAITDLCGIVRVNKLLDDTIEIHYDCEAVWLDSGAINSHQTVWNEYIQRPATDQEIKLFLLKFNIR